MKGPGEVVEAIIERVFGRHEAAAIGELFAPALVEAVRTHYDELLAGFPDLAVTTDMLVTQDDLVAARLTLSGTHAGSFAGVPASGRFMSWGSMRFYRVGDGRVVETWAIQDRLGLFQQLGLVEEGIGGIRWAAGSPRGTSRP